MVYARLPEIDSRLFAFVSVWEKDYEFCIRLLIASTPFCTFITIDVERLHCGAIGKR